MVVENINEVESIESEQTINNKSKNENYDSVRLAVKRIDARDILTTYPKYIIIILHPSFESILHNRLV